MLTVTVLLSLHAYERMAFRGKDPFPTHFQGRQAYATCFGQWHMTDMICPVKAHFQQVIHHIRFLPASSTIQDP